ncbi:hypothetical protein AB6A40_000894 [Gnathostoma spinigerum]|uniref:Chondroitin sulfate proteoglycan 4 n=1 Tax=Gnathostoma spinigerum TaxID=75299 RepID=A0ABD6E3Z9_9BILA
MNNLVVSPGGSVALNITHIDLTRLMRLCGEVLLIGVSRNPRFGTLQWLSTFNGSSPIISANQLISGRSLIYRTTDRIHILREPDEMILYVYPSSESSKRTSRLWIPLRITFTTMTDPLLKIEAFSERIRIVSGGEFLLIPAHFQLFHPRLQPSSLVYRLAQTGSNGVTVLLKNEQIREFTQADINKGKVKLKHHPHFDEHDRLDVLTIQMGHHIRCLVIDILPLSLSLHNHTDITLVQGSTYVVLNRTHLGASSNGDRSKIVYNVIRAPQNGTFYWVAGEKEATSFTQKDIDQRKVLYAQLNMQAHQDSFEFSLGNDQGDVITNKTNIIILPVFNPNKLFVSSDEPQPVSVKHLNASVLEGSAPRFLVTQSPRMGHFVLDNRINDSVLFFSFADIRAGRLSFRPFQTKIESSDFAELQLEADGIQPSRFRFPIQIRTVVPSLITSTPTQPMHTPTTPSSVDNVTDITSSRLILLTLLVVCCVVILIVICRFCFLRRKHQKNLAKQKQRERSSSMKALSPDRPDLLDTTVYATIRRNRTESLGVSPRSLHSFESSSHPKHHHHSPLSSPSSETFLRTQTPSLDYSILGLSLPDTSRTTRPNRYQTTKLKESQYWV